MAIHPPEAKVWWKEHVALSELLWIWLAFLWGVIMFFMMVYWHLEGRQNISTEAYRIDPQVYEKRVDEFVKEFKVRDEAIREFRSFARCPVMTPICWRGFGVGGRSSSW